MNKLCRECLHELNNKEKTCPVCGTKVAKNYKKTLKIAASLFIPILIISSIFIYIISTNSELNVTDQFSTALAERDSTDLQKLIIHQDGSAISKTEAQAVVALIKELGEIDVEKFFFPIEANRLLNTYKMTAKPVSFADLEKKFSLILADSNEKYLIPGRYKTTIIHEDTLNSELDLVINVTEKNTIIPQNLHLRQVGIENFETFPITFFHQTEILMNDKTATLEELVNDNDFSVFSYQMPQYQLISTWPWGEVTSDKNTLVTDINLSSMPLVSKEQLKVFSKMLTSTLDDLVADKIPTEYTSKEFQKELPQLVEPLPSNTELAFFEESNATAGKNGSINGVNFQALITDGLDLNVVYSYSKKEDAWKIEVISSPGFKNDDVLFKRLSQKYGDPLFTNVDLAALSEAQMNYWFTSIYSEILVNLSYIPLEYLSKAQDYENIFACPEHSYTHTDIQSVKILTEDTVQLKSIDACSNHEQYEAVTVLKREPINYWSLKKAEPRRKITTR